MSQLFPAPDRRCRRESCGFVVDAPLGPAVEQLVERDAAFQPGQVRAEAVVQALAERQVAMLLRWMSNVSGFA